MRRVRAATASSHGVEQLAARLAGGFAAGVEPESLRQAVQAAPVTNLGELDEIECLPGFVGAAADTLRKAWRSGIDLPSRAGRSTRLAAIAALEAATVARLPASMLRPRKLAGRAMDRIAQAPAVRQLRLASLSTYS